MNQLSEETMNHSQNSLTAATCTGRGALVWVPLRRAREVVGIGIFSVTSHELLSEDDRVRSSRTTTAATSATTVTSLEAVDWHHAEKNSVAAVTCVAIFA
jgi:hypothetical protein